MGAKRMARQSGGHILRIPRVALPPSPMMSLMPRIWGTTTATATTATTTSADCASAADRSRPGINMEWAASLGGAGVGAFGLAAGLAAGRASRIREQAAFQDGLPVERAQVIALVQRQFTGSTNRRSYHHICFPFQFFYWSTPALSVSLLDYTLNIESLTHQLGHQVFIHYSSPYRNFNEFLRCFALRLISICVWKGFHAILRAWAWLPRASFVSFHF